MCCNQAGGQLENILSYEKLSVSIIHPESPENCDIEFHNVSFTYPGSAVKALDGIDFRLPAGRTYALVGESGGGKTTIARLIPRLWEADEATASLDVENETKIQTGLSELVKDKTVLVIAHRMRTIANTDKVVVIEDGHVSECGSPGELRKSEGWFARMSERQRT